MLRIAHEVVAHTAGQIERVAESIVRRERRVRLKVLVYGVELDDQRPDESHRDIDLTGCQSLQYTGNGHLHVLDVGEPLVLQDLRGNVDTRLRKLREGACDAILLAVAGLERLGRRGEVTEVLEPDVFLPAPGQGAIALECREDDGPVASSVAPLNDPQTSRAVAAERALLAGLQGGCNVPLGAYAVEEDGALRLTAFVSRADGSGLLRGQARDVDPLRAGASLAEQLLARGARELMQG